MEQVILPKPVFPQTLEGRDSVFPDDYILKEELPGPWERHVWGVKLARNLKNNLHLEVHWNDLQIMLSKVNVLRKERSGSRGRKNIA